MRHQKRGKTDGEVLGCLAIVPLVAIEKESGDCRALLAQYSDIVVRLLTSVEVISALTRRVREKLSNRSSLATRKNNLLL